MSSDKYVADGIPVLTAGKTFILGYTNETNGIKKASKEKPVILFDDFTTDSRFINFDFKIKSSAAKILTEQNGNDIYFLFHILKNIDYKPQDHQRHWISIFENFNIFIPSYDEQKKISNVFEIIEERETDISRKIETLKKYKEGLIQEGFKLLECNSDKIKFSDLFKPFNIRNKDLLPQYTVGKSGLKLLDEGNYDISNHKTFSNDCLILGIGIEEIGISENLNGSISPVYSVYKIKNPDQTKYFKYFLKPYLWKNKRYFTRKSTRREYEIDSSELSDIRIQVPNNRIFDFLIKSLEAIDDLIEAEEKILDNIISIKNFLLKGMFI